ncbi:MAG TPA: hypothetical protein PK668_14745 [Myxococcota bacterium]|nr:hypothetical protein [Myxococcota bacterium]HRY93877.1 hypothetical protein [Myxococcota bacterium]HSA23311.1 hypothetical protein [Myxococcota bacterium]
MRARILWLAVVLFGVLAVASLGACNKQKPPVLDYTQKEEGFFTPTGKPGAAHVGRSPQEEVHNGFQFGPGDASAKPEDPAKKPEDPKKPADPPKKDEEASKS